MSQGTLGRALLGSIGERNFRGYFLALDTIPPIYLKFGWNPVTYVEDWEMKFSEFATPMSRAPRIGWSGGTTKRISFTVRADQSGVTSCWNADEKNRTAEEAELTHDSRIEASEESQQNQDDAEGLEFTAGDFLGPDHIQVIMHLIESLKLPKSPTITGGINLMNINGAMLPAGGGTPSPPKVILGLGQFKHVLGYVASARPTIHRMNRKMQPTRISYQIDFIVLPGTWLEVVGDIDRVASTYVGLTNIFT